jgi:hypothetical protein
MLTHTLEVYDVYFYILSFFALISMVIIILYKNTKYLKKIIMTIAITILLLQFYIVYETYPNMEHLP